MHQYCRQELGCLSVKRWRFKPPRGTATLPGECPHDCARGQPQLVPYQGSSPAASGLIQLVLAFLGLRLAAPPAPPSAAGEKRTGCRASSPATRWSASLRADPVTRDHYILIPICAVSPGPPSFLPGCLRARAWQRVTAGSRSAAFLLWFTPFQLSGPNGVSPRAPLDVLAPGTPSLRNRIQQIAALPARRPLQLLSAYPELPFFLPQQLLQSRLLLDAAPGSFDTLLEREHIELVWLDDELTRATRFAGDPTVAASRRDPERHGFSARATHIRAEYVHSTRMRCMNEAEAPKTWLTILHGAVVI